MPLPMLEPSGRTMLVLPSVLVPFAQLITSVSSTSQGVTLAHFLHIPIDECEIPLYDGNVQLPELQSGVSVNRVVLGLTNPSRIATLVSRSNLQWISLGIMYLAVLIDASSDAEGRPQGIDLTACWLRGPIPTERTRTRHPISAGSLF